MKRGVIEEYHAADMMTVQPEILKLASPKNKDILLDDHDNIFAPKKI